jgi:hypothetical protein
METVIVPPRAILPDHADRSVLDPTNLQARLSAGGLKLAHPP